MAIITQASLIQAEALTVERSGQTVLRDVSFAVSSGECVAIVGPNGSGKTSLMLALLGLLPHSGHIRLAGKSLHSYKRRDIARQIAYVPQQTDCFMGFTVGDVVAAARYVHQGPFSAHGTRDRAIIGRAIEECGISSLRHRVVQSLSGGERQKVWLAAAVAQESPLLFLDEPTTALDPKHQRELILMLRRLHAADRTLVLICHDLNVACMMQARVLALREGALVYDGGIVDFVSDHNLQRVFDTTFELHRRGAQSVPFVGIQGP